MDTNTLTIARYVMGVLSTEYIVDYANKKLDDGIYSDHLLSIIDQEHKHWDQTSKYFESFCAEQSLKIPSFQDAAKELIRHHLEIIIENKQDPIEQFGMLLFDINNLDFYGATKKYVGDSIGIHHLYGLYHTVDDLDFKNREQGMKDINKEMIEESKRWLENN